MTRLRLLAELERHGTMTAVSEVTGMGTSAVSKHLAVLEREVETALLVPDGRRVRLTPAGQRLAERARDILARTEAARAELCGEAEPAGTVNLATFAGPIAPIVLPALQRLAGQHPEISVGVIEHEPDETMRLLLSGDAVLGLVYDYSLVPRTFPDQVATQLIGTEPMLLVRPEDGSPRSGTAADEVRSLAGAPWIANSRSSADDELAHRMCAICGFVPHIRHRIDALESVADLAAAGLGVGFVPELGAQPRRAGVDYVALGALGGERRFHLAAHTGAWPWPPIRALGRALAEAAGNVLEPLPRSTR